MDNNFSDLEETFRIEAGGGDAAGGAYAIAYAIMQLARATDRCATHLKYLGVGDAATTMGAIEYLTVATNDVASAIRAAGEAIATADRRN